MPIPQFKTKNIYLTKGLHPINKKASFNSFKPKKKKKPFFWKAVKFFVILFILGSFFGVLALGGTILWLSKDLPDPNKLMDRAVALSTKIYDRTGETLLYEIHGDQKRTFITIEEIPQYAVNATVSIEDKNFYEHKGISLWGIFRGVVIQKLRGKRVQGGSTLTQQFIKNSALSNERTITRKIKEWILAWRIEKKFSKPEILQMYFNEIPYGGSAYGIESASNLYFDKSARDLSLAESSILAALPQAPTYYSPHGSHKDELLGRAEYILSLMLEQNYIDEEQYKTAKENLPNLEFKKRRENILAPHFVFYIKEILSKKYGERLVEQGGLKVITTLDLYKQKKAEEAITAHIQKNDEKYNSSNAALVAIDPKTGQILAMVGSRDYFDDEHDGQVNVAIRDRQPGSSLKPIIYALAFEKGYTPETILYDVKTNFGVLGAKEYSPNNYDGKFRGPISIRKSLGGSLNVPAVKTLYLAGIDNAIKFSEKLGYTTFSERSRFGLSLVLGGGEVKLLEHVGAFSAFAREGEFNKPTGILEVSDKNNRVLEEYKQQEKRVLDGQAARLLNNVLSDNSARAWAFGENNLLTLSDRPVAAKTGTTNDYKDAWTIGFTPSLVAGVWTGNNDGAPMKRGAGGSTLAAPIWNTFMRTVLGSANDTPIENFNKPESEQPEKPVLRGEAGGKVTLKIDKFSKKLATEYTPQSAIIEQDFLEAHSILHYLYKDNPRGEIPQKPEDDPQYELWEQGIEQWLKTASTTADILEAPPTEYDDVHLKENKPSLSILNLKDDQIISSDIIFIDVDAVAPRGVSRVEYYVDGSLIDTMTNEPYDLYWAAENIKNGFHTVKAICYDDVDNSDEFAVKLNIKIKDSPLSAIFISPTNNYEILTSAFPFEIKIALSRISRVSKVNFFVDNLSSGDTSLIASEINPKSRDISVSWKKHFGAGFYRIYAVAEDLNKGDINLGEVLIRVK